MKNTQRKRPLQYWKPFNTWWREFLKDTDRRPDSKEIAAWYNQNAWTVWPDYDCPTLADTRVHAKCMRSVDSVREYFRTYRTAKRKSKAQTGDGSDESDGIKQEDEHGDWASAPTHMEQDHDDYLAKSHPAANPFAAVQLPVKPSSKPAEACALAVNSNGKSAPRRRAAPRKPANAAALAANPLAHTQSLPWHTTSSAPPPPVQQSQPQYHTTPTGTDSPPLPIRHSDTQSTHSAQLQVQVMGGSLGPRLDPTLVAQALEEVDEDDEEDMADWVLALENDTAPCATPYGYVHAATAAQQAAEDSGPLTGYHRQAADSLATLQFACSVPASLDSCRASYPAWPHRRTISHGGEVSSPLSKRPVSTAAACHRPASDEGLLTAFNYQRMLPPTNLCVQPGPTHTLQQREHFPQLQPRLFPVPMQPQLPPPVPALFALPPVSAGEDQVLVLRNNRVVAVPKHLANQQPPARAATSIIPVPPPSPPPPKQGWQPGHAAATQSLPVITVLPSHYLPLTQPPQYTQSAIGQAHASVHPSSTAAPVGIIWSQQGYCDMDCAACSDGRSSGGDGSSSLLTMHATPFSPVSPVHLEGLDLLASTAP